MEDLSAISFGSRGFDIGEYCYRRINIRRQKSTVEIVARLNKLIERLSHSVPLKQDCHDKKI